MGLGHLPTHVEDLVNTTAAVAEADDGSLIIGNETVAPGSVGEFAWTPTDGIRAIDAYLLDEHGFDLTGWTLHYLTDMTPDGRFIIGNGSHPLFGANVAFRIALGPEPGALVLGLCSCVVAGLLWQPRSAGPGSRRYRDPVLCVWASARTPAEV